ncbi:MAG: hypothetical protein IBV52_08995 [Candidatus Bathyarchaeota archaeon]
MSTSSSSFLSSSTWLQPSSAFKLDGLNITTVTSRYDPNYMLIYTIKCNENIPTPVTVNVWDQRGIKVIAQKHNHNSHLLLQ